MAFTNETIKLIIRTANNKYADFNLELSSLLTVYDLKQKITLNHPTKPVRKKIKFLFYMKILYFNSKIPKDQRLIFSGKLLDDTTLLHQIFIKVKIHLNTSYAISNQLCF